MSGERASQGGKGGVPERAGRTAPTGQQEVAETAATRREGNQVGSGVGGIDVCPGSGHQQQAVVVKEESPKADSFVPCCCRSQKDLDGKIKQPSDSSFRPSSSVHSPMSKLENAVQVLGVWVEVDRRELECTFTSVVHFQFDGGLG
ncbi:hypothetical protein DFJ73DRAFT_758148 [Zopfochytrium polystomum]|nr:hypothetical protein DFJ73DRAFT_758148 [Zopfochytrium polystomum]